MSYEHSSLLYVMDCCCKRSSAPLNHPSVHLHAKHTMTAAQVLHVTCLEASICLFHLFWKRDTHSSGPGTRMCTQIQGNPGRGEPEVLSCGFAAEACCNALTNRLTSAGMSCKDAAALAKRPARLCTCKAADLHGQSTLISSTRHIHDSLPGTGQVQ